MFLTEVPHHAYALNIPICPTSTTMGSPGSFPGTLHCFTGMDKTCVYTSFYGFICVSGTDCVQVRYRHIRQAAIPARVVLGTAVFCDHSNQYLVYEFPFCAMHMRVSSVSLPYLQNRLPSLIMSAILAQYSSLCDHLVLQFNLG